MRINIVINGWRDLAKMILRVASELIQVRSKAKNSIPQLGKRGSVRRCLAS